MPALLVVAIWTLAAQPAPTVSIDLHALPEQSYRELDGLTLERKLSLRLIQDGFAVVSFDQPHVDIALSISGNERGWIIEARTETQRASRTVTPSRRTPLAEVHLELTQHASQLARELRPKPVSAPPPPVVAPTPPPPPTAETPTPPPPPEPWLDLGIFGSALIRDGGVDPLLLLRARAGVPRIGGQLEAGLSFSSSPAIQVFEPQVALGPSVALLRGETITLCAALEAALVLHSFSIKDPFAQDRSGTRAFFGVFLPVDLQWHVTRHVTLELRVAGGWSPALEHTSESETLWSRGAFRLETGAGVQWSL